MTIVQLNHINLRGSRETVEALREFYCTALGFCVGPRPNFTSQGYWLYAGNQALIHLTVCRPGEVRTPHTQNTLDHVAFTCKNYEQTRDHLLKLKVDIELDQVPGAAIRQIFFYDPAGNGVELTFITGI